MPCPQPDTLLAFAFHAGAVTAHDREHIRTCGECAAQVREIREAAAWLVEWPTRAPAGACLDEPVLASIAIQGARPGDPGAIRHLSECTDCRERLAAVMAALAAPAVAAERQRAEARRWARRSRWWPAAAAAGIAVLLLAPQLLSTRAGQEAGSPVRLERDQGLTLPTGPVLVSPRGTVASAELLAWSPVPGADRYEVTVFGQDGDVVWSTTTADTVARLPASVRVPDGELYLWKVAARTGWDRVTESELGEFRIRRGVQ